MLNNSVWLWSSRCCLCYSCSSSSLLLNVFSPLLYCSSTVPMRRHSIYTACVRFAYVLPLNESHFNIRLCVCTNAAPWYVWLGIMKSGIRAMAQRLRYTTQTRSNRTKERWRETERERERGRENTILIRVRFDFCLDKKSDRIKKQSNQQVEF